MVTILKPWPVRWLVNLKKGKIILLQINKLIIDKLQAHNLQVEIIDLYK